MKTTVSEKGQITIPKAVRTRLGIRPGQVLDVHDEGGRLIASKVMGTDPVQRVYGILKLGTSSDRALEDLRGRADATDDTPKRPRRPSHA
jgi:antitoxin PrlF